MKIFLIRHGEKEYINLEKHTNKVDVGLTHLGVRQIENLGLFLSRSYPFLKKYHQIYSSPINRAIETAKIIQKKLDIPKIEINNLFIEFGPTNNNSLEKEVRDRLYAMAFNNHSFDNLSLNILNFFHQKFSEGEKNILISTHGALIRNTVYYLFPETRPDSDKILGAKLFHGSLTVLDHDGKNFKLERFNFADYLGSLISK